MFDVGWSEILVVVIVALLVVGPDKLPEVARTLARFIRQAQRVIREVRETINLEDLEYHARRASGIHPEAGVGLHAEKDSLAGVDPGREGLAGGGAGVDPEKEGPDVVVPGGVMANAEGIGAGGGAGVEVGQGSGEGLATAQVAGGAQRVEGHGRDTGACA